MKTAFWVVVVGLMAQFLNAQTFSNYQLTNFVWNGSGYVCSTNLSIPTNTIAKIINFEFTASVNSGVITVQYPGQPAMTFTSSSQWINWPVMGPCTATVTATSTSSKSNLVVVLTQWDVVNTTPQITGLVVQPSAHSASVSLQSSTNLLIWQTATNGTYPATNSAKFFRLNFSVSP